MRRELLRQFHQARIVEVRAGHVNEFGGLLLDGRDHIRMAVARGYDGDSGGEIEKRVSVNILHQRASSAPGHHRIASRIGGGNELPVEFEDASGVRPRQGGNQFRQLGVGHGRDPRACVRSLHR